MSGATATNIAPPNGQDAFTVDHFCAALIAQLAIKEKHQLPIGAPSVEDAFQKIVDYLYRAARQLYKQGNEVLAQEVLDVLDGLRPNPNTGAFDEFWASLRRQQPGRVGVPNPRYQHFSVRLSKAHAESELESVPNRWKELIEFSGKALSSAL